MIPGAARFQTLMRVPHSNDAVFEAEPIIVDCLAFLFLFVVAVTDIPGFPLWLFGLGGKHGSVAAISNKRSFIIIRVEFFRF